MGRLGNGPSGRSGSAATDRAWSNHSMTTAFSDFDCSIRSIRGLQQVARRDLALGNQRRLVRGIHPPCFLGKTTHGFRLYHDRYRQLSTFG